MSWVIPSLISSILSNLVRQLIRSHFATCMGDTLASELGILSPGRPIHLLTLRPVPPGTNGAVSLLGLGASALGGALMGLTMVADLAYEDPATRHLGARGGLALLGWGTAAGLVGSLVSRIKVPMVGFWSVR
jgi:uncharacterized membrane protein